MLICHTQYHCFIEPHHRPVANKSSNDPSAETTTSSRDTVTHKVTNVRPFPYPCEVQLKGHDLLVFVKSRVAYYGFHQSSEVMHVKEKIGKLRKLIGIRRFFFVAADILFNENF